MLWVDLLILLYELSLHLFKLATKYEFAVSLCKRKCKIAIGKVEYATKLGCLSFKIELTNLSLSIKVYFVGYLHIIIKDKR